MAWHGRTLGGMARASKSHFVHYFLFPILLGRIMVGCISPLRVRLYHDLTTFPFHVRRRKRTRHGLRGKSRSHAGRNFACHLWALLVASCTQLRLGAIGLGQDEDCSPRDKRSW
ncbi:hypothetical protein N656DRAFT_387766 [Canariomyces notabilis]|uniref:Uncharacterized protein n=1 Tax=Canariomyces notabilis TaxID=2074819 RepID=A0AAN6TJG1_9PEZI|nr:hypothetical protein N656DRAFT_387766 [Canariomyces arenarius]